MDSYLAIIIMFIRIYIVENVISRYSLLKGTLIVV